MSRARKPEIVADAAWWILTSESAQFSGRFLIDEEVLRDHSVTDFDGYAVVPGTMEFVTDLFLD